jgi:hypothetical protein
MTNSVRCTITCTKCKKTEDWEDELPHGPLYPGHLAGNGVNRTPPKNWTDLNFMEAFQSKRLVFVQTVLIICEDRFCLTLLHDYSCGT